MNLGNLFLLIVVWFMTVPCSAGMTASQRLITANHPPAIPTWAVVHGPTCSAGNNETVTNPSNGNLLVVAINLSSDSHALTPVTAVTVNGTTGTNSLQAATSAYAQDSSYTYGTDIWYIGSSAATTGTTKVAITNPGVTLSGVCYWEVSGISTSNTLDVANHVNGGGASCPVSDAAVTTTVNGDFIVTVLTTNNTVTAINAGWTLDSTINGNAFGHVTSNANALGVWQPVWTCSFAGGNADSTAAFKP